MSQAPNDLDETSYEKAFEFLVGFLIIPFITFVIVVTINFTLRPASVTEGVAILYVALLSGLYYTLKKDSMIYFGDTTKMNFKYRRIGLTIFFLLLISFYLNTGADFIL